MSRNLIYSPVKVPTKHQVSGIKKILTGTSLNFDDQGLGKTKQAYDAAGSLLANKSVEICLFITKAALIHTIKNEIEVDAIQLTPMLVTGDKRQRMLIYKYLGANCLVLSYDTLIRDIDLIENLLRQNKSAIFFDESHYLKNEKAQRTIAALKASVLAVRNICFSGTPAPNSSDDLFTQLKISGHNVGDSLKDFKRQFDSPEALTSLIDRKFIRRRKESVVELGIPPKSVVKVRCKVPQMQKKIYSSILSDTIELLEDVKISRKIEKIDNILVQLLRLNQAACNPALIVNGYIERPAKFIALASLVSEILERREKVIIWTSFKSNIKAIKAMFPGECVLELSGDISAKKKFETATRFQNDVSARILVGVPAAAREGFTLTAANHAIFLDRNFSNLDWLQAQDRIHRIGQKRACTIYALIASSTIDEQIDGVLERKECNQINLLSDKHSRAIFSAEFVDGLLKALKKQSLSHKGVKK